jgi:hypothetical protein
MISLARNKLLLALLLKKLRVLLAKRAAMAAKSPRRHWVHPVNQLRPTHLELEL